MKTGMVSVVVDSLGDLNNVQVRTVKENERFQCAMANLIPFSEWPRPGTAAERRAVEEIRDFATKELVNHGYLLKVAPAIHERTERLPCYLLVTSYPSWNGQAPSQQWGWGMLNINILFVEKGWAVIDGDSPAMKNDSRIVAMFGEAQRLARNEKRGIWQLPDYANKVAANGNRMAGAHFMNCISSTDLDSIVVNEATGRTREQIMGMSHVLPFKRWPDGLSPDEKQLLADARAKTKTWFSGALEEYVPNPQSGAGGNRGQFFAYQFYSAFPTNIWTGELPAEQQRWCGFNLNILAIQEGLSPFMEEESGNLSPEEKNLFRNAEDQARHSNSGIWQFPNLAKQLKTIVQKE